MKDRRVVALERVLSRRRERERKLDAALAAARAQARALETELAARREAAGREAAELERQDGKIDAMMGGNAFRADQLLMLREYRAVAAERHAALAAEAERARRALADGEAAVEAARGEILRNRARVDIYAKRRDTLVRALALTLEDAGDDESAESRRPAPRPF
jgi:flagellar biosynthesis/type III secretory pathway protein FliH